MRRALNAPERPSRPDVRSSVAKKRTESGIHWYQLRQVDPHVTLFILAKLTDGGNTFEAVSAMGAYPDSFESGTRNQTYQRESAR